MRIVVIGGTGRIGSKLVQKLREDGHDPLAASLTSGVDALTGEGLAGAIEGGDAVIDVLNRPVSEDEASLDFFQTSSRNVLAAEAEAGVGHHVVLSNVGAERLPESGYFRAKLAQEALVMASMIPYTILRTPPFFEFIEAIADSNTEGDTVRLPPAGVQAESAADVAAALADIATKRPLNATVELAGPEPLRLDELARRVLGATNDPRRVTTDVHARYFGAELDDQSLAPGENARIAPTRFEEWLSNEKSQAESAASDSGQP